MSFGIPEHVNVPVESDPFLINFLGKNRQGIHVLSVGSKSQEPERASSLVIFIVFPGLGFHSTPQFELIFQCLGLAGRFSVSISGVRRMFTPKCPGVPRRARGSLEEGVRQ